LAYPSLIVIFLTSSFLKRTVCTPEIAFTTVLYGQSLEIHTFLRSQYTPSRELRALLS
jgi:hypothetical protein